MSVLSQLTEEKRELQEEERKASEEYIQRLLAEEEQLLRDERKRRDEDERLARLLSDQLVSGWSTLGEAYRYRCLTENPQYLIKNQKLKRLGLLTSDQLVDSFSEEIYHPLFPSSAEPSSSRAQGSCCCDTTEEEEGGLCGTHREVSDRFKDQGH